MQNVTAVQAPSSLFNEKIGVAIRIWHWLTYITISASLITVLLASTFFSTKKNILLVQQQVQQKGGVVTPEQARAVAHQYNDKLWELHTFAGYGLALLFLSRIIIEACVPKEQKLLGKIRKASGNTNAARIGSGDQMHYLLVKRVYLLFYLLLLVMVTTGLGLAFEDIPFLKENHRTIKSVHSFCQYLVYFYIIIHLSGVIRSDLTEHKGIVSRMINGKAL